MRDERYKYFTSDFPTSALIGVKRLADPALMVEIECMAVITHGTVQTSQLISRDRYAAKQTAHAGAEKQDGFNC